MAIDRAVDSSFLDGGLNNIAAAIRDKTGKSDFLAFPDDFVTEISGITGGGGGDSDYEFEIGTITFAESYKPYSTPLVINHNLSTVPCLFIASNGCKASFPKYQICYLLKALGLWSSYLRSKNSAILYSTNAGSDGMSMISGNYIQLSTSSITISGGSSAYDFNPSGTGTTSTLKWLAVAEKA